MEPASGITEFVINLDGFRDLIQGLQGRGYRPVGPVLRDGSIVYDTLNKVEDLPVGWVDEQSPGRYRLHRDEQDTLFAYSIGPQSWKKFLHPPEIRVLEVERRNSDFPILPNSDPPPRYALIGVRPCELAAIRIQDRVLIHDRFTDPIYQGRRDEAFIVAVNCTRCASTCFCNSMQSGPRAGAGFDLALTEFFDDGQHLFLVETGTESGDAVLDDLHPGHATADQVTRANQAIAQASAQTRKLDTMGLREFLQGSFYHPHWDAIAARCLGCANCTMVCPTCFCTNIEDSTDVAGGHAERWRRWDSCFSQGFSYIHGGSVRKSAKSRYRQWLTHKLSSWVSQFGTFGCVGCGRCIAWCPAGIDLTQEVRVLREQKIPAGASLEDENGDA